MIFPRFHSSFLRSFVAGLLLFIPLAASAQPHFNGAQALDVRPPVCGHRAALADQPGTPEGRGFSAQSLPARPA